MVKYSPFYKFFNHPNNNNLLVEKQMPIKNTPALLNPISDYGNVGVHKIKEYKLNNTLLEDLKDETTNEFVFLSGNKISTKEKKLKELGFINSEEYRYRLSKEDERLSDMIPAYIKKYGSFISDKSMMKLDNTVIVEESKYPHAIPDQVLDKISNFKLQDENDYALLVKKGSSFVKAYSKYLDIVESVENGGLSYADYRFYEEIKDQFFISDDNFDILDNEDVSQAVSGVYLKIDNSRKLIYRERTIDNFVEFKDFKNIPTVETVYLQRVSGGYVVIADWTDKTKEI